MAVTVGHVDVNSGNAGWTKKDHERLLFTEVVKLFSNKGLGNDIWVSKDKSIFFLKFIV